MRKMGVKKERKKGNGRNRIIKLSKKWVRWGLTLEGPVSSMVARLHWRSSLSIATTEHITWTHTQREKRRQRETSQEREKLALSKSKRKGKEWKKTDSILRAQTKRL